MRHHLPDGAFMLLDPRAARQQYDGPGTLVHAIPFKGKVETAPAQLKEVCNLMKPGHLRKLLVAVIVVGLDPLIAVIAA